MLITAVILQVITRINKVKVTWKNHAKSFRYN